MTWPCGERPRGKRTDLAGKGHGRDGFTLLEVMVAFVITLLAVAALNGGIAGALRTARATGSWREAVSRAQSRLAAMDEPHAALGERSGDDGNGYRWTTRVRLVTTAPPPRTARPGKWARGTGLYAVSVIVSWREGGAARDVTLDSAVLGPVPGSGP